MGIPIDDSRKKGFSVRRESAVNEEDTIRSFDRGVKNQERQGHVESHVQDAEEPIVFSSTTRITPRERKHKIKLAKKAEIIKVNKKARMEIIGFVINKINNKGSADIDSGDLKAQFNATLNSVTLDIMSSNDKDLYHEGINNLVTIIESLDKNIKVIEDFYTHINNEGKTPQNKASVEDLNKVFETYNITLEPSPLQQKWPFRFDLASKFSYLKEAVMEHVLPKGGLKDKSTIDQLLNEDEDLKDDYNVGLAVGSKDIISTESVKEGVIIPEVKSTAELSIQEAELAHIGEVGVNRPELSDESARNEFINGIIETLSIDKNYNEDIQNKINDVTVDLIIHDDGLLYDEIIENLKTIAYSEKLDEKIIKKIYASLKNNKNLPSEWKQRIEDIFKSRFLHHLSYLTKKTFMLKDSSSYSTFLQPSIGSDSIFESHPKQATPISIQQARKYFLQDLEETYKNTTELLDELKELTDEKVSFNEKNISREILTNVLQEATQFEQSEVYKSLSTPQEMVGIIKQRMDDLVTPALKILHVDNYRENIKIVGEIKKIIASLEEKDAILKSELQQKQEDVHNLQQQVDISTADCYNQFETVFHRMSELDNIQSDIDILNDHNKPKIKKFYLRIKSLFMRVKKYILHNIETSRNAQSINALEVESQKYGKILETLEYNHNQYQDSLMTHYLATSEDVMAETMKIRQDFLFQNPHTQKLIVSISLNQNNQSGFYQAIQDIHEAIKKHQKDLYTDADSAKSSIVFLYAFNKALEFIVKKQKYTDSYFNLNKELKNRFMQMCGSLNNFHSDIRNFGLSEGIKTQILADILEVDDDNIEEPEIFSKDAKDIALHSLKQDLSDFNDVVESSDVLSTDKEKFQDIQSRISNELET